jgi:hypothetical protein
MGLFILGFDFFGFLYIEAACLLKSIFILSPSADPSGSKAAQRGEYIKINEQNLYIFFR